MVRGGNIRLQIRWKMESRPQIVVFIVRVEISLLAIHRG